MPDLGTLITCRYSASLISIVQFIFVCVTYGGGIYIDSLTKEEYVSVSWKLELCQPNIGVYSCMT